MTFGGESLNQQPQARNMRWFGYYFAGCMQESIAGFNLDFYRSILNFI
jgi:hypothetical protein